MEIIKYPDPRLTTVCTPIEDGDVDTLAKLKEMAAFVANPENCAVGLALPQIGITKRGFVFKTDTRKVVEIAINPVIVMYGKQKIELKESCLSEEGQWYVKRATSVCVQFTDKGGKRRTQTLNGFDAVVFQHEYDHLEGKLIRRNV